MNPFTMCQGIDSNPLWIITSDWSKNTSACLHVQPVRPFLTAPVTHGIKLVTFCLNNVISSHISMRSRLDSDHEWKFYLNDWNILNEPGRRAILWLATLGPPSGALNICISDSAPLSLHTKMSTWNVNALAGTRSPLFGPPMSLAWGSLILIGAICTLLGYGNRCIL